MQNKTSALLIILIVFFIALGAAVDISSTRQNSGNSVSSNGSSVVTPTVVENGKLQLQTFGLTPTSIPITVIPSSTPIVIIPSPTSGGGGIRRVCNDGTR